MLTASGRASHNRVDNAPTTTLGGIRTARHLWIRSQRLRLYGVADVVELAVDNAGATISAYPVEYKHSRYIRHFRYGIESNEAQLCAQAMALEEMLNVSVPEGAIYYFGSKRRVRVPISQELRKATAELADEFHRLLRSQVLPQPVNDVRCNNCSLREPCAPELVCTPTTVATYVKELFS